MIISILDHMLPFYKLTDVEFKSELERINCLVFKPLFDKYNIENESKSIVMFILYGYSQESPMLISLSDNAKEKIGIINHLNIPEYLHQSLLELTDSAILNCVEDYLNTYAVEEWKLLQWCIIERNSWQRMVVRRELVTKRTIGKGDDAYTEEEFDVMGTMRANSLIEKLTKSIDKMQSSLKSRYEFMNLAQKEIIEAKKKSGGRSIALETSKEIIRTKIIN